MEDRSLFEEESSTAEALGAAAGSLAVLLVGQLLFGFALIWLALGGPGITRG